MCEQAENARVQLRRGLRQSARSRDVLDSDTYLPKNSDLIAMPVGKLRLYYGQQNFRREILCASPNGAACKWDAMGRTLFARAINRLLRRYSIEVMRVQLFNSA